MSETQQDFSKVGPVAGGKMIDLNKYDKQVTTIEKAEVVQVPSIFTPFIPNTQQHYMQWVLKVSSIVLESLDIEGEKIEFRSSEMFSLIQDEKGDLTGFPVGEGAKLMAFMKDLKIPNPDKLPNLNEVIKSIVGKQSVIKSYEKVKGDEKRTYLKFRY